MKKTVLSLILLVMTLAGIAFASQDTTPATNFSNFFILPRDFKVYTNGDLLVNWPAPGFKETTLPTINNYQYTPGCYIMCYSKEKKMGVYTIGEGIYVVGQVRVPGKYEGKKCTPKGYENKDVGNMTFFNDLCERNLMDACYQGKCWAGADTGGWFGMH